MLSWGQQLDPICYKDCISVRIASRRVQTEVVSTSQVRVGRLMRPIPNGGGGGGSVGGGVDLQGTTAGVPSYFIATKRSRAWNGDNRPMLLRHVMYEERGRAGGRAGDYSRIMALAGTIYVFIRPPLARSLHEVISPTLLTGPQICLIYTDEQVYM